MSNDLANLTHIITTFHKLHYQIFLNEVHLVQHYEHKKLTVSFGTTAYLSDKEANGFPAKGKSKHPDSWKTQL